MIYSKKCVICGKDFETTRPQRKCCSDTCSYELYKESCRRNTKKYHEAHKNDADYKAKKKQITKNYYEKNKDNEEFIKRNRERAHDNYEKKKK